MSEPETPRVSGLGLLRWVGWAQRKAAEDWIRERGLSFEQGFVLGYLVEAPGAIQRDIAEMTGTTLHTVSRILTAWEEAGLVDSGRQKLLVKDPHRLLLIADGVEPGLLG